MSNYKREICKKLNKSRGLAAVLWLVFQCMPPCDIKAQTSFPSNEANVVSIQLAGDSILKTKKSIQPEQIMLNHVSETKFSLPGLSKGRASLKGDVIYKKAKPGVLVVVMAYRAPSDTSVRVNLASGYAISQDGICVTNYHVVKTYIDAGKHDGHSAFYVQNGDGKYYAIAEVLKASKANDLAIIRLDLGNSSKIPFLSLSREDAEIGDPVFVLSNPQNLFYFLTAGVVSGKYNLRRLLNDGEYVYRNTLAITAEYAVGSSGGPILNKKCEVIGTVSSTHAVSSDPYGRNVQMVVKNAIPVSSLLDLL